MQSPRERRRAAPVLLTALFCSLTGCVSGADVGNQLDDASARAISHDLGPPIGDAQVPDAVTQTSKGPGGVRIINQQCPPGAQDAMGRTLVPQAEVGVEHSPGHEGGTMGVYTRNGCQPQG